ncbi:MAG: hypothetical protein K2M57_06080 [Paramuribaculum sp.]|nr:hypothetical protein [Paramuribaculum sp.]
MTGALKRLATFVSRRRHKRGFGIHSPFGFYFITIILAEGRYGYYCYPELNRLARRNAVAAGRLRMLMRVANFLAPHTIAAPGATAPEQAALCASDSSRRVVGLEGYAAVCSAAGITPFVFVGDPALVADVAGLSDCLLSAGTAIIARTDTPAGRNLADRIEPLGMTFAGKDMSIVVARRGLPHQKFAVAL